MKKILLVILYITNIAYSQVSIHSNFSEYIPNTYYQDLENYYDPFVGTWQMTSTNLTIEIRFRKIFNKPYSICDGCTADYLIGEMRLVKDGVEVLNSLSNLNVNYSNPRIMHNIVSIGLNVQTYPFCPTCPTNVNKINFWYDEHTNNDSCLSTPNFDAYIYQENGIQKLKLLTWMREAPCGSNKNDFTIASTTTKLQLVTGQFTLMKQ